MDTWMDSAGAAARRYFAPFMRAMPEALKRSAALKTLAKGEALLWDTDRAEQIFLLLSGSVSAIHYGENGSGDRFAGFDAPAVFGEFEAFAGCERYRSTILCEEGCTLLCLSAQGYLDWIRGNAALLFFRTCEITRMLTRQVRTERGRRVLSADERLCLALLAGAKPEDGGYRIALSREALAGRVDCSEKTVQRGIRRLREQGILEMRGRAIYLSEAGITRLRTQIHRHIEADSEEEPI